MAKPQRKLSLEDNSRRAKAMIFFDVCSFFFDFSVVFFKSISLSLGFSAPLYCFYRFWKTLFGLQRPFIQID